MKPFDDLLRDPYLDSGLETGEGGPAGRTLTTQDLIDFEHTLKDAIAEFLPFTSYSLFFPQSLAEHLRRKGSAPEYRAEEGELILPLSLEAPGPDAGEPLGYFVARGVKLKAPKTLPYFLAALARAQLEKILLYKQAVTDPLTGLAGRDHFLARLTREIELIQTSLMPPARSAEAGGAVPGEENDLPAFAGQLGVIVMDLDRFQWVNDRYGYLAGDDMVREVGRILKLISPKHVTAARLINDRFAVLLPDAGPRACFQLAELFRSSVSKLSFDDEVTGDRITITASLGTVGYPQGLTGPQLMRRPVEQARILLRQANKAVFTAKFHGRNRVFAFSDILKRGGRIIEELPMNRLAVSLGKSVGARAGQRFLVKAQDPGRMVEASMHEEERISGRAPAVYRGEVVLIDVQEEMGFAEVLHLADPAERPRAGDGLALTIEGESPFDAEAEEGRSVHIHPVTGLYEYRDFSNLWAGWRAEPEVFSLALVKIMEKPEERSGTFQQYMDARLKTVGRMVAKALGQEPGLAPAGGRFGLTAAIWFLPGMAAAEAVDKLVAVAAQTRQKHGFEVAAGVAQYPCLSFNRAEVMDMCRKALDHALLLPEPRLAAFDSISMNIAADKRSSEGDLYGAVEEYKLSLLADADNTLARNSLGVALAQLGRFEEARREFERVAEAEPDNLMARYNLGWALLRLGSLEPARKAFEDVLALDPSHVFARIRLAVMAEKRGDAKAARRYYEEASRLPGGEPLSMRHLARLALDRGEKEEAREYLHLALKANHNDAAAMHLLSKLYLDSGEDPQIAEVLARQSAALAPHKPAYWDLLERALREQGKEEEADKVAGRKRVV